MRRRRLLQMGAALAALPLAGCGASSGEPRAAGKPAGTAAPPARAATTPGAGTATGTVGTGSAAGPGDEAEKASPGEAGRPDEPAAPALSRVIAKVGRNHGHVFTVSFADVLAGEAKTYDLTGTSGHPHAVTLSADDMLSLIGGQIVRMQSTRVGGHAHRLFVRCAPPNDPPEWVSACEIEVGGKDEHEMVIPAADMAAKVEKTYDIQGVAGHPHAVTVTAEDFRRLEKGEALTLTSSTSKIPDPHAHLVFIKHAPPKKG